MRLTTQLAQILQSGKVTLYTDNVKDFEVKASNKKIDLNVNNRESVKKIISSMRGTSTQFAGAKARKGGGKLQDISNLLDMLMDTAEDFLAAGITLTLSYKGDKLLTIGANAKPKLSSFLTGEGIEINNLPKLVEIVI